MPKESYDQKRLGSSDVSLRTASMPIISKLPVPTLFLPADSRAPSASRVIDSPFPPPALIGSVVHSAPNGSHQETETRDQLLMNPDPDSTGDAVDRRDAFVAACRSRYLGFCVLSFFFFYRRVRAVKRAN